MTNILSNAAVTSRLLTTEELAITLAMSPQSIRKRFCLTGEYFGVRPIKMPNGRLFWPSDALQQLASRPRTRPVLQTEAV